MMKIISQTSYGDIIEFSGIDADLSELHWFTVHSKYLSHSFNGARLYAHRIIVSRMVGRPIASGEVVDHIDGNIFNNRRENLRLTTPRYNGKNKGRSKRNKSGFKGVTREGKRWRAEIRNDGAHFYLGSFETAAEAAQAYNEAALKHMGKFARLNIIPSEVQISGQRAIAHS